MTAQRALDAALIRSLYPPQNESLAVGKILAERKQEIACGPLDVCAILERVQYASEPYGLTANHTCQQRPGVTV